MNHWYTNKKVLITGGAGFVGSHLSESLITHGAHVRILDDLSTGSLDNIASIANQVEFIQGTITDFNTCLHATKDIHIIFHTAAFISVPQSFENPQLCYDINITGTQYLLETARINKVERFIFSSSCAVYGNTHDICTETMPCNPTSPYAFSKYIGEQYLRHYADMFNMKTVSLRYFNIYGPRQNPHGAYAGVIARFRHQLQHNLPLTIFGDGSQSRDFIPVASIVEANLCLTQLPEEHMNGDVYNIGTGSSISLLEMIDLLKKEFPTSTSTIEFLPQRQGDIQYSAADCSKYLKVSIDHQDHRN